MLGLWLRLVGAFGAVGAGGGGGCGGRGSGGGCGGGGGSNAAGDRPCPAAVAGSVAAAVAVAVVWLLVASASWNGKFHAMQLQMKLATTSAARYKESAEGFLEHTDTVLLWHLDKQVKSPSCQQTRSGH